MMSSIYLFFLVTLFKKVKNGSIRAAYFLGISPALWKEQTKTHFFCAPSTCAEEKAFVLPLGSNQLPPRLLKLLI